MLAAHQLATRVHAARRHGLTTARRRVPLTRPPTLIESDYAGRLVGFVVGWRTAARHLTTELPLILRADAASWRFDDDPGRRARRAVDRVRAEIDHATNDTALEGVAESFVRRVSVHQRGEITRQAKAALGVDVPFRDPKLAQIVPGFVHENVALIKKLQGSTLDNLRPIVVSDGGSRKVLLWLRGTYRAYTDYQQQVVALFWNR